MVMKRYQINGQVDSCIREFRILISDALIKCAALSEYNFDISKINSEQAIYNLQITQDLARETKKDFLKIKKSVDDILFNLQWFENRNCIDKRKVEARENERKEETQEN